MPDQEMVCILKIGRDPRGAALKGSFWAIFKKRCSFSVWLKIVLYAPVTRFRGIFSTVVLAVVVVVIIAAVVAVVVLVVLVVVVVIVIVVVVVV